MDLDISIISKIQNPHQAPIKSLKFLDNVNSTVESKKKFVYLIAGSYDQVISISKLDCEENQNAKVSTKKFFIDLAELNGIHGYYQKTDGKIVIYAVGQGLEYYEYFFDF